MTEITETTQTLHGHERLCIYHGGCDDGFAAAWVVHKYHQHRGLDDTDYYPAVYNQEPPPVAGKDVVIVDFSYKRSVLERMAQEALSVTVLDHHETAQDELQPLMVPDRIKRVIYGQFDMNRWPRRSVRSRMTSRSKPGSNTMSPA